MYSCIFRWACTIGITQHTHLKSVYCNEYITMKFKIVVYLILTEYCLPQR